MDQDFAAVIETEEIENHGVWVPIGKGAGNQINVAAVGNPAFNKKQATLEKQYRRKENLAANKPIPDEDGETMARRAVYDTVLKGWRGPMFTFDAAAFPALQERMREEFGTEIQPPPVLPEGGKGPLPFNEANVLWYMERSKRFRRTVFGYASDEETFEKKNLDILGKA